MAVADLIEAGIRAYLAGREAEALAAFEEALRQEPGNAKARWYVDRIGDAARAVSAAARRAARPALAPPEPEPEPEPEQELELASTDDASPPPPPAAPRKPLAEVISEVLAAPHAEAPPAPQARPALASPGRSTSAPAPRPTPESSVSQEEYAPSPWDDGPAVAPSIELESSGGLDLGAVADKSDLTPLVPEGPRAAAPPRTDVEVWLSAAKELFALGDFSGSLELIEKILQVDSEHGEARDYLRQNEATLISMYESKLGPLSHVPRLAVKPEEILWLNLDHRAGFLLAQIDGTVDYDSLFALSGLPRLDTARILANLIADGVITS